MRPYLLSLGIALPWVVVGLGCRVGYQLLRQNGRILLRLEELEEQLAQLRQPSPSAPPPSAPRGLPLDSLAPDFELPNLAGEPQSLSQLRGQRVLLIFFNPRCGFCVKMAPALAALPTDGAEGRPLPLVVSTGDVEPNRRLVEDHDIRCPVLLQEQAQVSSQFKAGGTPTGYLIDEAGHIASHLAVGAPSLLALAGQAETVVGQAEAGADTNGRQATANDSLNGSLKGSLAESRINRSGLTAGTPAPAFRLPQLDGGELSLHELRGRKVLLVFSDPHCGPCQTLGPHLEQLQRRRQDLQVVMISRGEVEENRRKVQEHALSFPVVLQKQWEVSREYGIFATPVGYLIDEAGIIVADVAKGPEAILALVSGRATSNGNQP